MDIAHKHITMTMITRILSIILLSVSLFGGASGIASAAEGLPSPHDKALLALINQARQNPLAVAASMGMDPDKIVKDLPELEKILREGLSAVTFNRNLFGGASGIASAAEGLPSPHDEALLALINQARQNPLAVAASMGMDPDKIVKDLPELEKILREGLPAVTFNRNLSEAARAHTQDMFANGYYSHDSPDGRGYDARIRDSGYRAVATGESLGILCFANFINPGDAVRLLFGYMFWDELDPSRTEKRNILDPRLKEVGVSFDTGVLSLGGARWNVYLVTCDFGAVMSGPEELLHLINQARANPLGVAESLGIDTAIFLEGRPELRAAFEQGLPPLTINASLLSASEAHVRDMLENNYYGKISWDGRTYKERIEASGYRFAAAGESLGITWFTDSIDPSLAVGRIFEGMFRDELDPSNTGNLTILDPRMKEAGIALEQGVRRSGNEEWKVYLAICDVGTPSPVDPGGG